MTQDANSLYALLEAAQASIRDLLAAPPFNDSGDCFTGGHIAMLNYHDAMRDAARTAAEIDAALSLARGEQR